MQHQLLTASGLGMYVDTALEQPASAPDQAALENVRAVAASSLRRSSVRSVFARADVVLAWHASENDTHLVPLINEVPC